MLRALALSLSLLVVPASAADPPAPGALYECRTIVTGTDARDRPAGLARCFIEVLVKISGNPGLRDNPQATAAAERAEEAVAGISYRDRMSGLPRHDDQGSSDRPYDLIVHFDPARVDAALASLGDRPWTGERPTLAMLLTLELGSQPPAVQGEIAARAHDALAAAGARYGMPLTLPGGAEVPGALPLRGTLRWSDADLGWVGDWQIAWEGKDYRWGVKGVSLDEAFRDAILGAMAVLSGHGATLIGSGRP